MENMSVPDNGSAAQTFGDITISIRHWGMGGALAGASTFALGKAFCYYYRAVLEGHIPDPKDLKRYYQDQLDKAEQNWKAARPQAAKKE